MKLTKSKLRDVIKEEIELVPLRNMIRKMVREIDFKDKESFKKYKSQHKMRPTTKVKIAGKETTVGAASGDKKSKAAPERDEEAIENATWQIQFSMENHEDEDVKREIPGQLEAVKAAGGTPKDLANKFKDNKHVTEDDLEILKQGVQNTFGEELPLDSETDATDEPSDMDTERPDEEAIEDAIYNALEGVGDAGHRDLGWDRPEVKSMVVDDFTAIKNAGGTVQDIADRVKQDAPYMIEQDLWLIDSAAEEIFGEPVPHGLSGDDVGAARDNE